MSRPVAQRSSARQRVLDAAVSLFAEHGVRGTSLQMIADHLGVGKAAVYYQFRTKDEIVLAVVRPVFEDMARVITIASALPASEAQRDTALSGLVEFSVRHRDVASLLFGDPAVGAMVRSDPEFERTAHQLRSLLVGADQSVGNRVTVAMIIAGVLISTADPFLSDISDADLHATLMTCSQWMLKLPHPDQ
ncbi:TetR/AcrR family transcriptional regulator [Mycolicibacterium sp. CBM1]